MSRPAHVHSPNASRTILSEKGGYTNVEGERCDASRGDIIITPNGTWHDHGNDADEPVIWIDMLDWPLMEFLDCAWVDQGFHPGTGTNAKSQEPCAADGYSNRSTARGGMVPTFVSHQLRLRPRSDADDPFPGRPHPRRPSKGCARKSATRMKASNWNSSIPVTGKPVFPTMDYRAQLLRPGEETLPKRETSSTFIVVIAGKGRSEIGGQTFRLGRE